MVYTQEEKKKMDNALQAFAEYTAASTEFDIAYSDKSGYVRLIIDEGADAVFFLINDFEDLVDMFCMEIVSDEIKRKTDINPLLDNRDVDYDAIRFQLQIYIDKMDEAYQQQAMNVVNAHILKCATSPYLP